MKRQAITVGRDNDELLTAHEAAAFLKLYKRDGVTLNKKRVYDLPVRRRRVPGVGVRFWKSDLMMLVERQAA